MVTTLGAAFAAAAVAVVAFCGSLMTTFCAAVADGVVPCEVPTSATTPAPAPPPITAPATRPAMPIRSLPERRGWGAGAAGGRPPEYGGTPNTGPVPSGGTCWCGNCWCGICSCGCGGSHAVCWGIVGCCGGTSAAGCCVGPSPAEGVRGSSPAASGCPYSVTAQVLPPRGRRGRRSASTIGRRPGPVLEGRCESSVRVRQAVPADVVWVVPDRRAGVTGPDGGLSDRGSPFVRSRLLEAARAHPRSVRPGSPGSRRRP